MVARISHTLYLFCVAVAVSLFSTSCADPIPTDYEEELIIEGFAIVGEPLANIRVTRTLPVTDTFSFAEASIKDAVVRVTVGGTTIPMEFVDDSLGGSYRARDTSYRVVANTVYDISVEAIGKTLTASTTTPQAFTWKQQGPRYMQYPNKDSLNFPGGDSLVLSWTPVPNTEFYLAAVDCKDTLGYGKYLTPQTSDTNERTPRPKPDFFDRGGTLIANERVTFGGTIFTSSQIVWGVFRWHGLHEIRVYAPNKAFLEWFYQVGSGRRSQYDYRLSNIKGGLGVWGAASVIKTEKFVGKHR